MLEQSGAEMLAGPFREGHTAGGCMWPSQARGRSDLALEGWKKLWLLLGTQEEMPTVFGPCGHLHSPRVLLATCLSAFLPASPCPGRSVGLPSHLFSPRADRDLSDLSAGLSPACLSHILSIFLLIVLSVGLWLTCCCPLAGRLSALLSG